MKTILAWIARDEDGPLHLFLERPINYNKVYFSGKTAVIWRDRNGFSEGINLPGSMYDEVTLDHPRPVRVSMGEDGRLQLGNILSYQEYLESEADNLIFAS